MDNIYVYEQITVGTLSLILFIMGIIQYRVSTRLKKRYLEKRLGASRGKLQHVFHRLLPTLGIVLIGYSVDPHGIWNVYNRLVLSLYRAVGAIIVAALVVFFGFVTMITSYSKYSNQRRYLSYALFLMWCLYIIEEFSNAILRSIYQSEKFFDMFRYYFTSVYILVCWSFLVLYAIRLRRTIREHEKRVQTHNPNSGTTGKAAKRLEKVWTLVKYGSVVCIFLSLIEAYLGYRSSTKLDVTPLNDEEAEDYTPRYIGSMVVQLCIGYLGMYLSWTTDKASDGSVSRISSIGDSTQNLQRTLSNRSSTTDTANFYNVEMNRK